MPTTSADLATSPITYPYLPEGRTILYVPGTDRFMIEAERARNTLSTDKSFATGAVVAKDGQIIGIGANQSGFKSPKLIALHKKGWCVRKLFKVRSGKGYWMCPGCSKSFHHAESRAARDAVAKKGKEAQGADLYLYGHWWCCKPCWDEMIKAGIKNVYLIEGASKLFKR